MTPLERAARAGYEVEQRSGKWSDTLATWVGLRDDERALWRERARAVLQAIREPDEETKDAGWRRMPAFDPEASEAGQVFTAMIDHITAEGGE